MINEQHNVQWIDKEDVDEFSDEDLQAAPTKKNKQSQAAELLRVILADGPVKAAEVQTFLNVKT